jgi:hypothetical protein
LSVHLFYHLVDECLGLHGVLTGDSALHGRAGVVHSPVHVGSLWISELFQSLSNVPLTTFKSCFSSVSTGNVSVVIVLFLSDL